MRVNFTCEDYKPKVGEADDWVLRSPQVAREVSYQHICGRVPVPKRGADSRLDLDIWLESEGSRVRASVVRTRCIPPFE